MNATIVVEAAPERFPVDPSRTAVIVVDMQNDFGSDGGMFSLAGHPIEGIKAVLGPIAEVLAAARSALVTIVYLKMQFEPDLSDAGRPGGPTRRRHESWGVGAEVATPDGGTGRILIRDTWNTEIVPQLTPQPGDVIIPKHHFSGFHESDLHAALQERGIDSLIFTGCTTSVCVESTLRDAYHRDYRCLLLSDCTAEQIGSEYERSNYDASILTMERFGCISDSNALLEAIQGTGLR